jgi:hypothetical protein
MRHKPIKAAADIEALARECIGAHSRLYAVAENIAVEFEDGVLVVRGAVSTYHLKQLLQTALLHLNGVERLDNQVNVIRRP